MGVRWPGWFREAKENELHDESQRQAIFGGSSLSWWQPKRREPQVCESQLHEALPLPLPAFSLKKSDRKSKVFNFHIWNRGSYQGILPCPCRQLLKRVTSTGIFYQIFKRNTIILLFKLFQRREKQLKETCTNSFYAVIIILLPKDDEESTKKFPNYRSISLMDINVRILNKMPANGINSTLRNNDQRMVQYLESY